MSRNIVPHKGKASSRTFDIVPNIYAKQNQRRYVVRNDRMPTNAFRHTGYVGGVF